MTVPKKVYLNLSPKIRAVLGWRMSGRIEPMVELIHCSHRTVYTNQTICLDPIETERSEATIPRRSRGWREAPVTPGKSMITVTDGSKRPGTRLEQTQWFNRREMIVNKSRQTCTVASAYTSHDGSVLCGDSEYFWDSVHFLTNEPPHLLMRPDNQGFGAGLFWGGSGSGYTAPVPEKWEHN